jgi:hypothetical protein
VQNFGPAGLFTFGLIGRNINLRVVSAFSFLVGWVVGRLIFNWVCSWLMGWFLVGCWFGWLLVGWLVVFVVIRLVG